MSIIVKRSARGSKTTVKENVLAKFAHALKSLSQYVEKMEKNIIMNALLNVRE